MKYLLLLALYLSFSASANENAEIDPSACYAPNSDCVIWIRDHLGKGGVCKMASRIAASAAQVAVRFGWSVEMLDSASEQQFQEQTGRPRTQNEAQFARQWIEFGYAVREDSQERVVAEATAACTGVPMMPWE